MPEASAVRIVASDVITALGVGVEQTWQGLLAGESGIGRLGGEPRTPLAAWLPAKLELEAERGSRVRTWALATTRRALEGLGPPRGQTGLVLASTKAAIGGLEQLRQGGDPPDLLPSQLCAALAAALQIDGPRLVVSSACSSGLSAVVQAARLLLRGQAARMLVVGVDQVSPFVLAGFRCLRALSDQPCRPFDAERDGLSLGEGAGALVLERAETGLARVMGWGLSSDAEHITGPSPSGEGLKRAFDAALAAAGWKPRQVEAINAHGTATLKNDAMEALAIASRFEHRPPVFALKGSLGHTLGAAGVIEAALCARALRAQILPGSVGFSELGVPRPLRVLRQPLRVPGLRRILSVKCGFGGLNAVVALQADPPCPT